PSRWAGATIVPSTYPDDWNSATSQDLPSFPTRRSSDMTTAITTHTPNPSVVGQGIAVAFTVTSGGGTPTGEVTVTDGAATCTGTVAAGTCTLTSTTAGNKTLTATYSGDANFGGSTSVGVSHTVNAAATTTAITGQTPNPSAVGQAVSFGFGGAPGGTPVTTTTRTAT